MASLTLARWVLAKVLGLVATQQARRLGLGSRPSGEFLVEADDALQTDSIRSSTDCLLLICQCESFLLAPFAPASSVVGRPSLATASHRSPRPANAVRPIPTEKAASSKQRDIPWERQPVLQSVSRRKSRQLFVRRRKRTLGGMSVDSARRVTWLIVLVRAFAGMGDTKMIATDLNWPICDDKFESGKAMGSIRCG